VQDAGDGIDAIQLAILRGLFDGAWRNSAGPVCAGVDERMLAENVDHARDPPSVGVHGADCVWLKNGLPISACDAKPLTNVAMSLFET